MITRPFMRWFLDSIGFLLVVATAIALGVAMSGPAKYAGDIRHAMAGIGWMLVVYAPFNLLFVLLRWAVLRRRADEYKQVPTAWYATTTVIVGELQIFVYAALSFYAESITAMLVAPLLFALLAWLSPITGGIRAGTKGVGI